MAEPDDELNGGRGGGEPGFVLLAPPAFLLSVISSFLTQNKGGGREGGGRLTWKSLQVRGATVHWSCEYRQKDHDRTFPGNQVIQDNVNRKTSRHNRIVIDHLSTTRFIPILGFHHSCDQN